MKEIKKKYSLYALLCLLVVLFTLVLSYPHIKYCIPLYTSQEIVDWVNMVVIPIALSLATSGLVTVWFSYKSEKENFILGLNKELYDIQSYAVNNQSRFYEIFYSPLYTHENKMQQLFTLLMAKPFLRYIPNQYPSLCENIDTYTKHNKTELLDKLNEAHEQKKEDQYKYITPILAFETAVLLNEWDKILQQYSQDFEKAPKAKIVDRYVFEIKGGVHK